ncbi:MAG TPA: ATP-binding cassette domain-containing protein, partial [Vicinamibacteria bacterium]|nr:ATP-binding cassette domain-containing protein [Vicinamibacteria bacterium]
MPDDGLRLEAQLALGAFTLDVRLSASPGETVVLVGPSGSGKSTCLDLIAGLLQPRSGRVECRGEVWCDTARGLHVPPQKRRVGLVFQDYALFPHLTVLANVAYGPTSRGRASEDAGRIARQWIERLGLAGAEG